MVLLDAGHPSANPGYRLVDAATGEFERGYVRVADMVNQQPWDDDVPGPRAAGLAARQLARAHLPGGGDHVVQRRGHLIDVGLQSAVRVTQPLGRHRAQRDPQSAISSAEAPWRLNV